MISPADETPSSAVFFIEDSPDCEANIFHKKGGARMLIRDAKLHGVHELVDVRIMHGRVQEIGVGLRKGLYESEMSLRGDLLLPSSADGQPPRRAACPAPQPSLGMVRVGMGTPLTRWRDGRFLQWIDSHSAD